MPSIDMPLDQLRQYKPSLYRQEDFEKYWEQTVTEAQAQPLNAELIPYDLPIRGLECFAVRFDGYKGGAWPAGTCAPKGGEKLPAFASITATAGAGRGRWR